MFFFVLYTFSQHFKTKLRYLMEFSWFPQIFWSQQLNISIFQYFLRKHIRIPLSTHFPRTQTKNTENIVTSFVIYQHSPLEGELAKKKTTLYIYDFPNMQNYLSNLSNSYVLKYTYSTLQSWALNKLSALLRVQSHSPPAKFLGNNISARGSHKTIFKCESVQHSISEDWFRVMAYRTASKLSLRHKWAAFI